MTVNAVVASAYRHAWPRKTGLPVYICTGRVHHDSHARATVPPHRYLTCVTGRCICQWLLPFGSKLQKDAMKDFADKDNAKQ